MGNANRLNVVLFIGDQWRAKDTGHFGNSVIQTPHIDSIVEEGSGFKNCFVQNPVSTPSRVSLASGWYCHVNGHRTMQHMLRHHEPNMLWYFKDAGYHVWWGGKNDMLANNVWDDSCHDRVRGAGEGKRKPPEPGKVLNPHNVGDRLYHTFLWGELPEEYCHNSDDNVIDHAVEFLERPSQEPFFMLINQVLPHPPYAVKEPYYSMYDRQEVPAPIKPPANFEGKPKILKRISERMKMDQITPEELQEMVAVYYGMITRLDANLGRILNALKQHDHWDNTLVLASSDHGDYAGDYLLAEKNQCTFEDSITNVPLAIRVPGCEPLPEVSEAMTEWVDILPTLADACNIQLGHTHFGSSLMPVIKGDREDNKDYVFCEGGALESEEHSHDADRSQENIYWARVALQYTHRQLHGKAVMIRSKEYKYVRRLYDTDELYDMVNDPDEVNNLIDAPECSAIKKELELAMLDWFLRTGDQVPFRWDARSPNKPYPELSTEVIDKFGFSKFDL